MRETNAPSWAHPYVLLTLAALQWGANIVFGRLAVGQIAPMLLVSLRWAIVFAVLVAVYRDRLRAALHELKAHWSLLLLLALTGYTGFTAFFYAAAHYTTGANMAIIQGSTPLFVFSLAFLAHGSRISRMQGGGMVLALLGVACVATHGSLEAARHLTFNTGDLFMLAATACYAIYTVWLADRPRMDDIAFFAALAGIALVTSLPLTVIEMVKMPVLWPTWQGWLLTVLIALFPSFLAQIFFMRGVASIGPGRAGIFVNLIPVFGAALSVLFLGEPFGWYQAFGLALVMGGIVLAQKRLKPEPAQSKNVQA